MDEEVLIPQGRLAWDPCKAASSLRIITHQEPHCVSVLGLCETRQSLPPLSFPKILYPKQLLRERPAATMHCCSWPASSHTAQGIPGKAGGWTVTMNTHTCSCVHNPTCLQPSVWLQLLKGMWRKIPSSKAQLQADSVNLWDARSCCCCVIPQCLVTAVKGFSKTPLPLGKHCVIPARWCHINCMYVFPLLLTLQNSLTAHCPEV